MHRKYIIPSSAQKKAIFASILIDVFVFILTIILGYVFFDLLWGNSIIKGNFLKVFKDIFWLPLIVSPFSFYFSGLYRRDPYRLLVRSLEKSFTGTLTAIILILIITYIFRAQITGIDSYDNGDINIKDFKQLVWGFSFLVLVFALSVTPLLIAFWRFFANKLENKFIGWSNVPQNLLIAGYLENSDIARLKGNHCPCYNVVGVLHSSDKFLKEISVDIIGNTQDLTDIFNNYEIDELVLVASQYGKSEILDIMTIAMEYQVQVWVVSDIYETFLSAARPTFRKKIPLFEANNPQIVGYPLVGKRIMDVVISSVVLLITTPIFIIPACIAIVIDSKGFPIFTQDRVGVNGKIFKLFKLRTMVIDAAQKGGVLTEDNDLRITKVGKFLRKSSIDELPQLWNVLKGDMSIVGPRAVIPYVANRFEDWEKNKS